MVGRRFFMGGYFFHITKFEGLFELLPRNSKDVLYLRSYKIKEIFICFTLLFLKVACLILCDNGGFYNS